MKWKSSTAWFLLLLCLAAERVWAKPGDFDTTFGNPEHPGFLRIGPTTLKIPGGYDSDQLCLGDYCGKIATRYPDGRLLFYMGYFIGSPFGFLRYETDGQIDKNFGVMGGIESKFGKWNSVDEGYDRADQILLQPDGKIVALGVCTNEIVATDAQLKTMTEEEKKAFEEKKEIKGSEIKKYLGYDEKHICLARYNSDGTVDAGFGNGGFALVNLSKWDQGHAITLQPDGKILVGGEVFASDQYTFPLLRFNPDGQLDQTFGPNKNGIVNTSFGTYLCPLIDTKKETYVPNGVTSLMVQPDKRILAAGTFYNPKLNRYQGAVIRLLPNGVPDLDFGDQGKVVYDPTEFANPVHDAVVLFQNGKIALVLSEDWQGVMAGDVDKGSYNEHIAMVRFLSNGAIDKSFGINGQWDTEIQFGAELDAVIQDDGKIVAKTRVDLLRFDANGKLDTDFGNGGKIKLWDESIPWGKVDYGQIKLRSGSDTGLMLEPDGRIVVTGSARLQLDKSNPQNPTGFHDGLLRLWGYDCTKGGTWYHDKDKDGFGDPLDKTETCPPPSDYTTNKQDCDDTKPEVRPNAPEVCDDKVDNDCDGATDNPATNWYADQDQDGYGDAKNMKTQCTPLPGFVDNSLDCDDQDPKSTTSTTYYLDKDQDGYGTFEDTKNGCIIPPPGYATKPYDCDEASAAINPGAPEVCDGKDNNCDNLTDEPLTNPTCNTGKSGTCAKGKTTCTKGVGGCEQNVFPKQETCDDLDNDCDGKVDNNITKDMGKLFYKDGDKDGLGDPSSSLITCDTKPPPGYVNNEGDCDDTKDTIGKAIIFSPDLDKDGFGDQNAAPEVVKIVCTEPNGYAPATKGWDCDDTNTKVYPGAPEICDGIDNDCNGAAEDNQDSNIGNKCPTGLNGVCGTGKAYCAGKQGVLCKVTIQPGSQPEVCSGADEDCDGQTDEADSVNIPKFYPDKDKDSFGDQKSPAILSCVKPNDGKEYVTNNIDCDDSQKEVNPDMEESCNGKDENCNGQMDEGIPTLPFYEDKDQDGHGNPNATKSSCSQPAGFVTSKDDCDDTSVKKFPGNAEVCDGLDNNCNTQVDEGNLGGNSCDSGEPGQCGPGTNVCKNGNLKCISNTDPFGEICNGVDDDCDGKVDDNDDSVTGQTTYYFDNDKDGFGNPNQSKKACAKPAGYASFGNDCDDTKNLINPDQEEICGNGIDDNCFKNDDC